MTRRPQRLLVLLLLTISGCATPVPAVVAPAPTYGALTYGFERKNWNVICKNFPVKDGERIPDEVAAALRQEGWLDVNHPHPAFEDVNHTCRRLGYPCTRPDPTCPTPTP